MTQIPLGGAKQSTLIAISTVPSFNYTSHKKDTIAPYMLYQIIDNAINTATQTSFNGQPVYLLEKTIQPTCRGDEAGVGGGVKSGTVGGEVKPTSASSTIFVEGKALIRQGDTCTMNNENTVGEYTTLDYSILERIAAAQAEQEHLLWAGSGISKDSPTAAELWKQFLGIPAETAKELKKSGDKFLRNAKNYAKFFKGDFNAGMLTTARDIAEDYNADFAYVEGGVNIGGIETFGTISINVHNGKVYVPVTANAGIKSDSKPSGGAVWGIGWITDAPDTITEADAMDRGLVGKGSYTNVAYGGASITYSQTNDGQVSMASIDAGRTIGGSKSNVFGVASGSTNMEELDLSKQNIKYDSNKKEYIYNDDKKFRFE